MKNNYIECDNYIKIELTQGQFAIVDDDPAVLSLLYNYRWCATASRNKFYAYSGGKPGIAMHRMVAGNCTDLVVDHKSTDTLDNRKSNLRVVSHTANFLNKQVKPNKTTGYRGVWVANAGYRSMIMVQNDWVHLGVSLDPKQSAMLYDAAKVFLTCSIGLEVQAAHTLNFPDQLNFYKENCAKILKTELSAKSHEKFIGLSEKVKCKHNQKHVYVYLAINTDKNVKIGYTADVQLREAALKRGKAKLSDSTTTIFHYAELPSLTAARQLEAQLHKHFSAKRIVGSEFFNLDQHEINLAMMYLAQVDRNNIIIDDLTSASN